MLDRKLEVERQEPQAGIPKLRSYAMPKAEDVPPQVTRWQADPARAVLLIHDMQQFFVRAFVPNAPPLTDLVENTVRLYRSCKASGVPICYTAQPGSMDVKQRGLLRDFWGPGMERTSEDRSIIPLLEPPPDAWMLVKWRYSAFHRTDLLERMRGAGKDQLIICGVYAHVGVLMTACDAMSWDLQPFVVADAIGDFDASYHALTLEYASKRCASVKTTSAVLAELSARSPTVPERRGAA